MGVCCSTERERERERERKRERKREREREIEREFVGLVFVISYCHGSQ